MGYVCYLRGVNEQTTAASITEEQEHEEWEDIVRDEEKKERSTACAHLGHCGVCHGSVPQMKMRGREVGRLRTVASTHRLGQPRGGYAARSSNSAERDTNVT